MSTLNHRPVLLNEVLAALQVREDGYYIDGTFGRGGHAAAILQQLGPTGRLLAVDQDPAAVAEAQRRFGADERFEIVRGSFTQLRELAGERNRIGRVDGILLDLGVSSPQLDDPGRGFSFRHEGPLDMRMDPERGPSAADWLASVDESELVRVLREFGEERYARRIARAVLERRAERPIVTTRELATLIAEAIPRRERHKDPATRSFQAIRIAVNRELEAVDAVLPQAVETLAPGGRMAIISFHSLEDRRVKRFIRGEVRGGDYSPDLPLPLDAIQPRLRAVGKAIRAGKAELAENPRARSAVLRVAERLA